MVAMRDPRVDEYIDTAPDWQPFLYDGGLAPDPESILTGGHGNETGRLIAIRRGDPINERAMVQLFRAIIADNRAGGWRKLKKSKDSLKKG